MKNDITDILARLLFTVWVFSGILFVVFALAALKEPAMYSGLVFVGIIVLVLLHGLVKWILTGSSS